MTRRRIAAGVISAVSWGTVFVFGEIGVRQGACHPVMLSLIRVASASCFLALYALLSGSNLKVEKRDLPAFAFLGLVGIFGMNVLVFYALKYTSSTSSSILMNANPILIGLMAWLILKEKISGRDVLGILVGFSGCYLTISQGRSLGASAGGDMLAVAAAFCWAAYTVMAKKTGVIARYGPVTATFWPGVFGSALMLLALLLLKIPFHAGGIGWLVGIYLGLIPAGIGFTLWFFALQGLRAVETGVLQFLAPLTTGIIAFWWLKERISGYTIAGGVLILAGALLPFVRRRTACGECPTAGNAERPRRTG